MVDSVLDPGIRPGEYRSGLGGRHLGALPMAIAGLFAILLFGGILFGTFSRMQSDDDRLTTRGGELPTVAGGSSYQVPVLLADDANQLDGYIAGQPEPVEAAPDPIISPIISEALQAQREHLKQQTMRELQNRALGQESSPSISISGLAVSSESTRNDVSDRDRSGETSTPVDAQAAVDRTVNPDLSRLLAEAGNRFATDSQEAKISFLEEPDQKAWLSHTRQADLGRYTLKTGTVIPGILVSGLNSDLPGALIGQVSQNVYDTATGQYLLIPQGAKLYGTYDSRVGYGQNRALVAWDRIIFPDASTLELGRMAGADVSGYSGFRDKVDHHYLKLFGQTFLLSAIQAVPSAISDSPTVAADDEFGRIAAANYSKMGEELIDRNLSIQPTIRIRPGYQFTIMVNRDILFTGPYQ